MDKTGSVKAGSLAVATGGLSILASEVFKRATSAEDPCVAVIEGQEATRSLFPDALRFHDPDRED